MNCTFCGSARATTKFTLKNNHRVVRCPDCGIEFLSPQLNDEELDKLYSENYYAAWGIKGDAENETTRQMKKATFQLRIDTIHRLSAPRGPAAWRDPAAPSGPAASSAAKILDVGCATGYFLEVAQQEGFDPYGIEFSEYSASIAKKKFGGEKIFKGTLEQLELTDDPGFASDPGFAKHSFLVIAMSDLIEHVRNPVETLSKAKSLLTDDGVIMIMTPDTGTLSNKVMGRRWAHYKLEHFSYFNRRSMNRLAAKCELQVAHYEKSKKALNVNYLHTQLNVYRHWLLTPLINTLYALLPMKLHARNFYFSIGEMVVILKKQSG
jgi:2-polyprenyl-3-methyl-5-hydroxy-6-metoxy-1,4-benzoquinol methylase